MDKTGGCILSYNGGAILDCRSGQVLYQKLDPELVPQLCDFAAQQDVAIVTYDAEPYPDRAPGRPLGAVGGLPTTCRW